MARRAEEKEKRRQERLAAEQAAQRAAARRKRIGLAGGGVLAAAIVVVIVLLVAGGGGDDGASASGDGASAAIPERQIDNLMEAARAAGCEVGEHEIEGREHTEQDVEYETNPPTSGPHHPVPSQDGVYAPDNPPDVEASVHSLEHGRVLIQYAPGTPPRRIAQLETLFNEEVKGTSGYHTLLFQNQTGMDAAVAATAWGRSLTCPEFNDQVFDALRAFREQRVDKGPEFIP